MPSSGYTEIRAVRPSLAGDIKPFEGLVLSDGKIVLAFLDGQAQNTKLARLNSNGTLDTSFGSSGFVSVPVFGSGGLALSARASGDIWVALNAGDNSNPAAMQLYQVNTSGSSVTHILSSPSVTKVAAIAEVSGTGLVYLGLGANPNFSSGMGLRFVREGGQGGGNSWVDLQYGLVESAVIASDGSAIVLAKTGGAGNTAQQALKLIKFSTSGVVDSSFGTSGQVQFQSYQDPTGIRLQAFGGNPPPQSTGIWIPDPLGIAIDQSGRILVAFDSSSVTGDPRDVSLGGSGSPYQVTNSAISVARFLSNGSVDNSFGSAGIASYSIVGDAGFFSASEIQSNGTSLADSLLSVDSSGNPIITFSIAGNFRVVKFGNTGVLDSVYQTANGSQSFSATGTAGDRPMWTAVSSDQSLIVGVVDTSGTDNIFSTFKLSNSGTLDTGFGSSTVTSLSDSDTTSLASNSPNSPICFTRGTLIHSANQAISVESLTIGSKVHNKSGGIAKCRWIGYQRRTPEFAQFQDYLPVKISAGALDENLPLRDLYLSPDHAVLVDGHLIHAKALVNGKTIVQMTEWEGDIEYYHIETEAHEIIYAEGVPCETFIDNVSREQFDNYAEYQALYPNTRMMKELPLPRVKFKRQLPTMIKQRLESRIIELDRQKKG
jgi:uncharacterized delta-60 repeat protein